ncbi:MAG: hypothetical protein QNJ07_01155 [Woeseiaceae bacterium]|nr:hypothetical protein [Woeseiaceae bacterium]
MRRLPVTGATVALLLFLAASVPAEAEYHYRYEGSFSAEERFKLETWVGEVRRGLESLVGPFLFDVDVYFARVDSGQPVVFSNTLRGKRQGIRLRVDPRYPLEDFLADWTAPHELSHLVLPYLGRDHSWFAEGFASFMQYQVMHAMGTLSTEQVAKRYAERIAGAAAAYRYAGVPFVRATPRLRQEHNYPTMYWGGAIFFLRLNEALMEQTDTDAISLVADYMRCCRKSRDSLSGLVASLDDILGEPIVAGQLSAFRASEGFPAHDDLEPGVIRLEAN